MEKNPFPSLKGRYAAILLATLSLFVLAPLLPSDRLIPWELTLVTLLVFFSSLRALWTSRTMLLIVGFLGAAFLVVETLEPLLDENGAPVATDILGFAFQFTICFGILYDIFGREKVTADTVYGASAVYLLLGLAFARLFLLIEHLDPGAFAVNDVLAAELEQEGWRHSGVMQYFSLVTLTTIGYGDISPVSPLARNLAAVEGVIGQLFIAAVVARLVSLYTPSRQRRP